MKKGIRRIPLEKQHWLKKSPVVNKIKTQTLGVKTWNLKRERDVALANEMYTDGHFLVISADNYNTITTI